MNFDPKKLVTLGRAVDAAKRVTAELDNRNINAYITLAKYALWLVAILLLVTMGVAMKRGDFSLLVQTCQAAVFLAATVLGFHEYKGSRILHVMRNLKQDDDK